MFVSSTNQQMRVLFLGTGAAINSTAMPTSLLLDGRILLDAGPGIAQQLLRAQVSLDEVEAVVITHLHGDHTFGLPFLLLEYLLRPRKNALQVHAPRGLHELVLKLLRLAYPDVDPQHVFACSGVVFADIVSRSSIVLGALSLSPIPVCHGDSEAYGFRVTKGELTLGFTGDTSRCESVTEILQDANIALVDVTTESGNVPGHMNLLDVAELIPVIKPSGLMVAVHRSNAFGVNLPAEIAFPTDLAELETTGSRWAWKKRS